MRTKMHVSRAHDVPVVQSFKKALTNPAQNLTENDKFALKLQKHLIESFGFKANENIQAFFNEAFGSAEARRESIEKIVTAKVPTPIAAESAAEIRALRAVAVQEQVNSFDLARESFASESKDKDRKMGGALRELLEAAASPVPLKMAA